MFLNSLILISIRKIAFATLILLSFTLPIGAAETHLSIYPQSISPDCFGGRARAYDECGDQALLMEAAKQEAAETGKTVLVVYGAEWCIWCHVFKSHLKGEYGEFEYVIEGPTRIDMKEFLRDDDIEHARQLADFAAANFVVVGIEAQYTDTGWDVLINTGAANHYPNSLPFIFTIDEVGEFAADYPSKYSDEELDVTRNGLFGYYRGYNRILLLEELEILLAAAQ